MHLPGLSAFPNSLCLYIIQLLLLPLPCCCLLHRWDTTSLSETPSGSGEPSPNDDHPTCEELLRQHEQQQAAAPLPRFDKALSAQQQQHEAGALMLLQEEEEQDEQEGLRELQLGLHVMPGAAAKGAADSMVSHLSLRS
jgi:hypothetical protein